MLHVTIDPSMLTGKPEIGTFNCEIAVNIAGCAWEGPQLPPSETEDMFREALYPWKWERPTKLILRWLNDAYALIDPEEEILIRSTEAYDEFQPDADEVQAHYNSIIENEVITKKPDGSLNINLLAIRGTFLSPNAEVEYNDKTPDPTTPTHFYTATIAQFAQYLSPINLKSRLTFFGYKENVTAPADAEYYIVYPLGDIENQRWSSTATPPVPDAASGVAKVTYEFNGEPAMFAHCKIESILTKTGPGEEAVKPQTQFRDADGNFRGHTTLEVYDSDELFQKQVFKEKLIRGTAATFDPAGLLYEFLLRNQGGIEKIPHEPADDQFTPWRVAVNKLFVTLLRDRYSVGNSLSKDPNNAILGIKKKDDPPGVTGLIDLYAAGIKKASDYIPLNAAAVYGLIETADKEIKFADWEAFLNDASSPALKEALKRAKEYDPKVANNSIKQWLELWRTVVVNELAKEEIDDLTPAERDRRLAIIKEKGQLVKLQVVHEVEEYINIQTAELPPDDEKAKAEKKRVRDNSTELFRDVAGKYFEHFNPGNLFLESIAINVNGNKNDSQFPGRLKEGEDIKAGIKRVLRKIRTDYVTERKGSKFYPLIEEPAAFPVDVDPAIDPPPQAPTFWSQFIAFLEDRDLVRDTVFNVDVDEEIRKLLGDPTDVPPNVLIKVDDMVSVTKKDAELSQDIAGYAIVMQRALNRFEDENDKAFMGVSWKGLNWARINLITKKKTGNRFIIDIDPDTDLEKLVRLSQNYFVPSFLPESEETEDEKNKENYVKNVYLTLANERLSLAAAHDLYEDIDEADEKKETKFKYLFQYLLDNGVAGNPDPAPPAYALWYGYHYKFAGFVVLNSGVLPKELRKNESDWVLPEVEIPENKIVGGTPYQHLRRVRFSKAYCEVSRIDTKDVIGIPGGLLTIASELPEPEPVDPKPGETERPKDRATYLLFDNAKGNKQESLKINVGKPMTNFWNWYAWRGDEFTDTAGKKKLVAVLKREMEIRNNPGEKNEENEYLDDPALENVLRIEVEQLHPKRQDEGGFFLKLETRKADSGLDVVKKGLVTVKMEGKSVVVNGPANLILVPPGTVVKITVKCLTNVKHFEPATQRFHAFMVDVLDSKESHKYEDGEYYYYTKPVEMIFEAAKPPDMNEVKEVDRPLGFNRLACWTALEPFETDEKQVALNIVKYQGDLEPQQNDELAYFSRAVVDHQVWHWNGRLTANLFEEANRKEIEAFPNGLDPQNNQPTNYAMKWEAWEFSDRPDFSSLRSTTNLTVRRSDKEKQTLFSDSRGVTDKALYYRFAAELFGRYELLGGVYAVSVKSEITLKDGDKEDGKNRWRRFFKPTRKAEQLPKPAIRFVIPLTLSVDECPSSSNVRSASLMIVLNDTWFAELGLAEKCEVGIERLEEPDGEKVVQAGNDQLKAEKPKYLNAGPDPILSGKPLGEMAKLSEQDKESGYYVEEAVVGPETIWKENPVAVFTPEGPAGLTFDFAIATPKLTGTTFILNVADINRFLVKGTSEQDATHLSEWGMAQIAVRRNVDRRLWEDKRFFDAIRSFCDLKEDQKSDEIDRFAKEYFEPEPERLASGLERLWTAFNAKKPDPAAYKSSFDALMDLYRKPDNEKRKQLEKDLLGEIKSKWSAKEWVQFLPDTSSLIPVTWRREHSNYGYVAFSSEPVDDSYVIRAKGLPFPEFPENTYEERTERYLVISERTYNVGGQPVEKYVATYKWSGYDWFAENDRLGGELNFKNFEGYARILMVRIRPRSEGEKEEVANIWQSLFGESKERSIGFKEVQDDPTAALPLVSRRFSIRIKKMTINELNLEPVAKAAAEKLLDAHPKIVFTSGRRTNADQANAMASNIIVSKDRKWIEKTYADSTGRKKLQAWVDSNPNATGAADLTAGLLSVLNGLTGDELSKVSKHLTGLAFDIQPVADQAEKIKKTIRELPGLTKFLEREGGLERWHAQF